MKVIEMEVIETTENEEPVLEPIVAEFIFRIELSQDYDITEKEEIIEGIKEVIIENQNMLIPDDEDVKVETFNFSEEGTLNMGLKQTYVDDEDCYMIMSIKSL